MFESPITYCWFCLYYVFCQLYIFNSYHGHLQQQHQSRQQGLGRIGAICGPGWGPFCGAVATGGIPLVVDASWLILLEPVPRCLHLDVVTDSDGPDELAPLCGSPAAALFSATLSVTLQDIWNNKIPITLNHLLLLCDTENAKKTSFEHFGKNSCSYSFSYHNFNTVI